jgi:hypothetical protein
VQICRLSTGFINLKSGLLLRIQHASGISCDQQIRSRFSVVFLIPVANVDFVLKFHVAPHASYSTFPKLTSEISAQTPIFQSYQSFVIIQLSKMQIQIFAKLPNSFPLLHTQTVQFHSPYFFASQRFTTYL